MLTFPPDISFVVQIVSFLVLWFGLKRLVFDPMQAVLDARDQRTVGERSAATAMRESADAAAHNYERRMEEVRVTLARESEARRTAIQNEERQLLNDARGRASAQLQQVQQRLARDAEASRGAIATEAQGLARSIFARIVGRQP